MKKLLSIMLVCVLLVSTFSTSVSADIGDQRFVENESNDTISRADMLYNDYTVSGTLDGVDLDHFAFTLVETSTVSFFVQANRSTLNIGVFTYNEECIAVADDSYYSNGYYYDALTETLDAGTYYFVILNSNATSYSNIDYLFYYEYEELAHTHYYTLLTNNHALLTCTIGEKRV